MNFSALDTCAVQTTMDAAYTILSNRGSEELLPIETDTLDAIQRHLFPKGPQEGPPVFSQPTPTQLHALVTDLDPKSLESIGTLWCLLPSVDGKLRTDKTEILEEMCATIGCQQELCADLVTLSKKVQFGPKLRLFRRLYPNVFHMGLSRGVGQFLGAYLGIGERSIGRRYDALKSLPADTFGFQLWDFYNQNGMKPPVASVPTLTRKSDPTMPTMCWPAATPATMESF